METKVIVDTMWVLFTAMLVFFMNLGFAAVESGLVRTSRKTGSEGGKLCE
jgi:Amt family ammonium transporter